MVNEKASPELGIYPKTNNKERNYKEDGAIETSFPFPVKVFF
ncbi:MAG: hypothetical protein RI894_1106 [Bacteroidota bacterium]